MSKKTKAIREKYEAKTVFHDFQKSGDKLVEVVKTERPAVIDFNDILACCEVEPDDDMPEPWKNCDGWEHSLVDTDSLEHTEHVKCSMHYNYLHGRDSSLVNCPGHYVSVLHYNKEHLVDSGFGRRNKVVVVTREQVVEWQGAYSAYNGESRQVYEERLAECRRSALKTLVRWYNDGWQYYAVVCDFLDYTSSLGGIMTKDDQDDDPYLEECKLDVAAEVVHDMEKDGYTVINKPVPCNKNRAYKQTQMRWQIAHHLGFDNMKEYLAWLTSKPK